MFSTKVGHYTGNGSDNRDIAIGVDLTVDYTFVMIFAGANQPAVFRTGDFVGDASLLIGDYQFFTVANYIQGFNDDGFQVGSAMNVNAREYYYIAYADTTGDSMKTGVGLGGSSTYTTGFAPGIVLNHVTNGGYPNMQAMTLDSQSGVNIPIGGNGNDVSFSTIYSLTSTGFTGHSGGESFPTYWIAFADVEDIIDYGTYTGNGTDNRDIGGLIDPDIVIISRTDGETNTWSETAVLTRDMPTGTASFIYGAAPATNAIQSLESGGFQIGTHASVNASSYRYEWLAFRHMNIIEHNLSDDIEINSLGLTYRATKHLFDVIIAESSVIRQIGHRLLDVCELVSSFSGHRLLMLSDVVGVVESLVGRITRHYRGWPFRRRPDHVEPTLRGRSSYVEPTFKRRPE